MTQEPSGWYYLGWWFLPLVLVLWGLVDLVLGSW